jgi:TPR repeat protein
MIKKHPKALLRLASIVICGPKNLFDHKRSIEALKLAANPNAEPVNGETVNHKTAQNGNAEAQNMLGELCELGLHEVPEGNPDITQAVKWYRRAVQQGHARAMFNMGALYEKGLGVEKDLHKSIRFYIEVIV